jgi:hypothetical protein
MFFNREFYDELFLNRDRTLFVKIELLNWQEEPVREIQGEVSSGNLSVDGNSNVRRTLNLNFILDTTRYSTTTTINQINISRKIKVFIGLENNTRFGLNRDLYESEFKFLAEPIIWFNLGLFVPTEASLSHGIEESEISVTAQDKMVLLNGDIAGQLGSDIEFVSTITKKSIPYIDIIREAVTYFGGMDRSKVLILDVPYYADSLARSTTTTTVYIDSSNRSFDFNTGTVYGFGSPSTTTATISASEIISIQFLLAPQEQNKIEVSSDNTVVDILTRVTEELPGDYEFFFDVDGNFIFQLKKNLTNRITEIERLQDTYDAKYSANFDGIQYIYDFRGKELVSSFSNQPSWRGIKNDFYLYGKDGIFYHVAIDSIPDPPLEFFAKTTSTTNATGIIGRNTVSVVSTTGIITGSYVTGDSNIYEYGTRVSGINGSIITLTYPLKTNASSTSTDFAKWTSSVLAPYTQPWQQYIIDLEEFNLQENVGVPENRYYPELKKFFEYSSFDDSGIYKKTSAVEGVWRSSSSGESEEASFDPLNPNGIPTSWNYFFDIIDDSSAEVSKFSVNAIGRRVRSITDNTISVLYFPVGVSPINIQPTFNKKVIIFKDKDLFESVLDFQNKNENAIFLEEEFKALGVDYISILESQIESNISTEDFNYINDAFSNIKNLIYNHTRFNESISFDSVPLYFLKENSRVALEDVETEISGDYYLTSFSIPLSNEEYMSCEAIKIYTN